MRIMPVVAVATAVAALAACGGGGSDASCADSITYAGRDYLGAGPQVEQLKVGEELGRAERPACDDGGDESGVIVEADTGNAYALEGVDPRWAIAFGNSADDASIYVVNAKIPKDIQALLLQTP